MRYKHKVILLYIYTFYNYALIDDRPVSVVVKDLDC